MTLTSLYQLDGQPLPAPDVGVELTYTDLDASDAGRDESGVMHRIVVRSKVPTWAFTYSLMSRQTYAYLQSILPQSGSFTFTYPDPADPETLRTCKAYLSTYSATWQGLRTDAYRNVKFSVISC